MRIHGKVKWFNEKKGYGFITTDDGQDAFVHYSSIKSEGYKALREGENVTLEIEEHDKGPWAINVLKEANEGPVENTSAIPSVPNATDATAGKSEATQPTSIFSNDTSASIRTLRVFLCHSSGDKPAVRDLYQWLRSNSIDPWLDEESLLPGQNWQREIPKAVSNSDVVIVCLSQSAINKRGYVQKEIKYALDAADEQPEGTIFLIPVKIEECSIPDRLKTLHWVNLFEETGYERLLRALRARAATFGLRVGPEDRA